MLLQLLAAFVIQDAPPAPPAHPAPPAPAAPLPAVCDLRIAVPVNRPLMVDVKRVVDLKLDVTVVGKKSTLPMRLVDEWRFIDVHSKNEEDEEACARQYVKTSRMRDGAVDDPEMNGLRVDVTRAKGQWNVATADERSIQVKRINEILEQAPATSLWISLPKEQPSGDAFEAELVHLLRTALDHGADLDAAPAKLRVDGFDAANATARVVGAVSCTITEPLPVGAMKLTCELAVELEIDLGDCRLRRVRFDGKATATSQGLMDLAGGGRITVELVTTTGDAVTAALREKPKFRSVDRKSTKEGVGFAAPSYWYDAGEDDESQVFVRSLSDETGVARVMVSKTAEKFDAATMLVDLKKLYPDAKVEASTNAFGKSVRFALVSQGLEMRGEMFALDPASTITFKLVSPPSLLADSFKEYEAMRKSLKRLAKK